MAMHFFSSPKEITSSLRRRAANETIVSFTEARSNHLPISMIARTSISCNPLALPITARPVISVRKNRWPTPQFPLCAFPTIVIY
jgi:hypothetical protein